MSKGAILLSFLALSFSLTACGSGQGLNQMNTKSAENMNQSIRSINVEDMDDRLTYNPGQTNPANFNGNASIMRSDHLIPNHDGASRMDHQSNHRLTDDEAAQIIRNIAMGYIRFP